MIPFDSKDKKHVIGLTFTIIFFVTTLVIIARWAVQKNKREKLENEWYVKNLSYVFSAFIDTAFVLKQHYGFGQIYCTPSLNQKIDYFKEDSLNEHLNEHHGLRFIWKPSRSNQIYFMVTNGHLGRKGDSVYVNSYTDKVYVYRQRKKIGEMRISSALDEY